MKKFFTLIAAVAMAASVNAQDYVIQGGTDVAEYTSAGVNTFTYEGETYTNVAEMSCTTASGFTGYILKTGKSFGDGSKVTYNDQEYTTFKLSNGAPTLFTIPSGVTITKIEFVGYSNDTGTDSYIKKLTDGNDAVVYTNDGSKDVFPLGKDASKAAAFSIEGLSLTDHFVITNGGKQPCLIMRLYKDGATGINSAVAEVEAADADAPAYNLAGQKVGANAKGIIIKDGKKYIRK